MQQLEAPGVDTVLSDADRAAVALVREREAELKKATALANAKLADDYDEAI